MAYIFLLLCTWLPLGGVKGIRNLYYFWQLPMNPQGSQINSFSFSEFPLFNEKEISINPSTLTWQRRAEKRQALSHLCSQGNWAWLKHRALRDTPTLHPRAPALWGRQPAQTAALCSRVEGDKDRACSSCGQESSLSGILPILIYPKTTTQIYDRERDFNWKTRK